MGHTVEEGSWIGGYTLIRRLGQGGSAAVWEARDEGGIKVAFKLLHPTLSGDEAARGRLLRQVRLVNQIDSGRVARVLDVEADALMPFVVMELVEGTSLDVVISGGPLSPKEAADLGLELAKTLQDVHAHGIAHRDLKPSNVMISEGSAVLIDFDLSRAEEDPSLTQTGTIMGTPGYTAPELLAGGPSPELQGWQQGDWFAWAGTILSALTGNPPFGRGALDHVVANVMSGRPDTSGLNPQLAEAFESALGPDPESRLGPESLLQRLGEHAGGQTLMLTQEAPTGLAAQPPPMQGQATASADSPMLAAILPQPTEREQGIRAAQVPPPPPARHEAAEVTRAPLPGQVYQPPQPGQGPPAYPMPNPHGAFQSPSRHGAYQAPSPHGAFQPGRAAYVEAGPKTAVFVSLFTLSLLAWLPPLFGFGGSVAAIAVVGALQMVGVTVVRFQRQFDAWGQQVKANLARLFLVHPWHLLLAVLMLVPSVLLGVVLAVGAVWGGSILIAAPLDPSALLAWLSGVGMWPWPQALFFWFGALLGLTVVWLTPPAKYLRRALSSGVRGLAPGLLPRFLLASVLVVLNAAALVFVSGMA